MTRKVVERLKADAERNGEDIRGEMENFKFMVADAKQYFGLWDTEDPVTWALLRVVQAQNELANAFSVLCDYGHDPGIVRQAFKERAKAIAALQRALEEGPGW